MFNRLLLLLGCLSFILPVIFSVTACTVENKSENCSINGRAVDCAQMRERNDPPAKPLPNDDANKRTGSTYSCGATSCQGGAEYCLKMVSTGGYTLSTTCHVVPVDGSSCDALTRDVKTKTAGPGNCATVDCVRSNSEARLSCYKL